MPYWRYEWVDRVDKNGNTTVASTVVGLTPVMMYSFLGGSAPPFHPVNEPIPLTPGSFLKFVDTDDSEIDLTILVQAANYTDLWNKLRTYPALFSPVKNSIQVPDPRYPPDITYKDAKIDLTGEGKLVVTTPGTHLVDGNPVPRPNVRELICRCISGFNYDPSTLLPTSVKATLSFYANQPYWRDSINSGFAANANGEVPRWFDYFPVRLGPRLGTFVAQFSDQNPNPNPIVNDGDVDTPLIWTIHGPGRNITLTNQTTGQTLTIHTGDDGLGELETLTINTATKTVVKSGNGITNWLNKVTFDSQFWYLAQGSNNIRVEMFGANNTTSDIRASYHKRYFGVI
jgi:hypothetical protein